MILWSTVIVIGLVFFIFWIKFAQREIENFQKEGLKRFQDPLQEKLEEMPKIQMPKIEIPELSEEEIKKLEEELKKQEEPKQEIIPGETDPKESPALI